MVPEKGTSERPDLVLYTVEEKAQINGGVLHEARPDQTTPCHALAISNRGWYNTF